MVTTLLAIALACIAAVAFALAARLQHDVVTATAAPDRLAGRALGRIVRSTRWRAGAALVLLATALHVSALALAPIAVVQPIGVLSLATAVVLGAGVRSAPLTPLVRVAVAAVTAGVAGFVVVTALTITPTTSAPSGGIQIVVLAALLSAAAGLRARGRVRCLVLAAGAAVIFGLGSTMIRATTQSVLDRGDLLSGAALAGEAVVLAACGMWLIQQAYASGPTAVTVAATTVLDPVTAVVVGIAFCGEEVLADAAAAAAQVGAALVAVAGVLVLARYAPAEGRPHSADVAGSRGPGHRSGTRS